MYVASIECGMCTMSCNANCSLSGVMMVLRMTNLSLHLVSSGGSSLSACSITSADRQYIIAWRSKIRCPPDTLMLSPGSTLPEFGIVQYNWIGIISSGCQLFESADIP
jgi:hypothetical protein